MSLKKFDKMSQEAGEKRKPGRPSSYSIEKAREACEWIASGKPLTHWCKKPGNPSYMGIMGWVFRYPEFAEMYAQAREIQADYDADTIAEMVGEVRCGKLPADAGRVCIDALKWSAAKRKARVYGDRVAAPEPGKVDLAAMSASDLRALIEAARGELATITAPSPALPAPDSAQQPVIPGESDS